MADVRYDAAMAALRTNRATFADLAALGEDSRAEIIDGVIVEKASPSTEHGESQLALSGALVRRFQRRPGGRWPGGWWFGTEMAEVRANASNRHETRAPS